MELGFIGLGRMGGNMVQRLLGDGHQVVVYYRSPDATALLAEQGARSAGTLQELVSQLCTSLNEMFAIIENDEQLLAAQIIYDDVDERHALHFAQVERGCNGQDDICRIRNRREFDEPNALFEFGKLLFREFK